MKAIRAVSLWVGMIVVVLSLVVIAYATYGKYLVAKAIVFPTECVSMEPEMDNNEREVRF